MATIEVSNVVSDVSWIEDATVYGVQIPGQFDEISYFYYYSLSYYHLFDGYFFTIIEWEPEGCRLPKINLGTRQD